MRVCVRAFGREVGVRGLRVGLAPSAFYYIAIHGSSSIGMAWYVPHGCYQYTFDLKSSGRGVAWYRCAAEGVPVGTVGESL